MKISILLPVFNTEDYLSECLDSILAQTETDWELLAINDFSTDGSWDILQRYQQRDVRIRALQNKEKGIIPALRLAYAESKGQLITRMDSDDIMTSDKLKQLKALLQFYGKGHLATGFVQYFAEDELKEGYQKYEQWLNGLTANASNFSEIYKECVIPSPAWMLQREDLDACGAFNPNTYPEDYDLCFRFYEQELKVVSTPQVLHHWRDYATRTSRTDAHYSDNRFLSLKLQYFLRLDRQATQPLCLWGAGRKGKKIAQALSKRGIEFQWFCDTVTKIGKDIYGVRLQPYQALARLQQPQIIVAVAAPDAQTDIRAFLEANKLEEAFFFC